MKLDPFVHETARRGLISVLVLGCGSEDGRRDAEDTGSPEVPCSTRTVTAADGSCRCPASDPLCPTRGYAHFTISNVEGSGLPLEVSYEVTEELVTDTVTKLVWERPPHAERTTWAEAKARCDALELGGRDDFRLPGRIELVTIDGDTVRDRVTGLVWERAAAEPESFERASARCLSLGSRLPSVRELQSIVDENAHDPAVDQALFPATPPAGFWSQTLRGSDPWHVSFLDGQTSAEIRSDEPLASRCVR
jgi:hypothetical protein